MCGYCITIVSALLWPALPSLSILPVLIVAAIIACKRMPFIAGSLIAISWISLFYSLLMDWNTGERVDTLNVESQIISFVHTNGDRISMDITLIDSVSPHILNRKLRLTWRDAPPVTPGQRWLLTIKPKSITSTLNQGSFNQQKNLLAKHIIGKGWVVSGQMLTNEPDYRTRLIIALKSVLADDGSGDLLLALLAGDRSAISSARWQQLRNTGTGHLFAISGLHLSVVSLWLLILARLFLYRYSPVNSRRNWLLCLAISALGAIGYAYLAGFSVSTQRALIMLLAFVCFSALKTHSSSWERLLYALFVVLVLDPLSMLSAGFWLSFSALAIILLTVSQYRFTDEAYSANIKVTSSASVAPAWNLLLWNKLRTAALSFWAVQWRLTLGLCVVQAIFFSGASLASLVVNLLLVPWFTLLLIPISLLSLLVFILLTNLGLSTTGVFTLAAYAMSPVVSILDYSSSVDFVWIDLANDVIATLTIALIGLYLMVNFKQARWRALLSVMFIPLLLTIMFRLLPIDDKRWQVHLLDVGQGLSLVIEQNKRAIIYDTGARYGNSFSYAERVALPFLTSKGINEVDYLVVSHGDNDHAGGAEAIIKHYPNVKLISDLATELRPELAGVQQVSCRPKTLHWQRLTLELLAPSEVTSGNNGSCVVRVSDITNSVLLSGDIERSAELQLLANTHNSGAKLQSRVLIAPHHGSKTSSTEAFIDAVSPELVLFPAGFRNRWGFPKEEIVERYQKRNISTLTSGELGQISILFNRKDVEIRTYRSDFAPFWYNQVFRFGQIKNPE